MAIEFYFGRRTKDNVEKVCVESCLVEDVLCAVVQCSVYVAIIVQGAQL